MSSTGIFGINAIKSRLQLGGAGIEKVILRRGELSPRLKEIMDLATSIQCSVDRVEDDVLNGMTRVVHQGVGMMLAPLKMKSEADLFDIVASVEGDLLLLVLDGVTDPRNLGACLRSAATLGVHAVVVPKDKSASLNDAAIKTASGGASYVPLVQVVNLARCLNKLQKEDVWVVGTQLEATQSIADVDMTGNIAIVLGSEGKGLRQKTITCCDFLANIPMLSTNFGFNVSVAAGICLYEANRQRTI